MKKSLIQNSGEDINIFVSSFNESISVKKKCINNGFDSLILAGDQIIKSITSGGTLFLCGNGGSAADAQHLAAELLVRLRPNVNRQSIPAISLALDTSTITACGNDFDFDMIFSRPLEALGKEGDVLIAMSTSGQSENVLNAVNVAKHKKMLTVGFLGSTNGKFINNLDFLFNVPSKNTAAIQEAHIVAGHALMTYIEDGILEKNK